MRLKIKAKANWSYKERELVKIATEWALPRLSLDVSPVPIDIILKGECLDYGDALDLDHKIVIRLFKSDLWIETLFHELEHARQYIFCELALEDKSAYWKGELYDRSASQYYDEPWEVQARKVEEKLSTEFRKNFLTLVP